MCRDRRPRRSVSMNLGIFLVLNHSLRTVEDAGFYIYLYFPILHLLSHVVVNQILNFQQKRLPPGGSSREAGEGERVNGELN